MIRTLPHISCLSKGFVLIVCIPILLMAAGEPAVSLRLQGKNPRMVEFIRRGGATLVSVTSLGTATGFAWQWDQTSCKLLLSRESVSLALCQDVTAYSVNGTTMQLPDLVTRQGAWLYLSAPAACELFDPYVSGGLCWNTGTQSIETDGVLPYPVVADSITAVHAVKRPDNSVTEKPVRENITTIVIDPGHGGQDPGAIGPSGVQEKNVVLKIGLELRDIIRKQAGITVFMTRDKDIFIPLQKRTRFANDNHADVFVSIHANSIAGTKEKKSGTKGYKVYFLSQAKNEDDKLVAMQENAVVELEHAPKDMDALQNIIIAMVNNEYLVESQDLSIIIDTIFSSSLDKIDRLHLGVGQAPFWVLNGAYMPSVLVEVGFISNAEEEKNLADPVIQKRIAKGLFEAIKEFKRTFEAGHE